MTEYHVLTYAEQKKRDGGGTPRGICPTCEVNFTLRKDNCMRVHKDPRRGQQGKRCKGSEQPSLGLENRMQYY